MRFVILLFVLFGAMWVHYCEAAIEAKKKAKIIKHLTQRIKLVEEGILGARSGTNFFHKRVCKIGKPLANWITEIDNFVADYPKNQDTKLLEIAAWFNDWTIQDVKDEYDITP